MKNVMLRDVIELDSAQRFSYRLMMRHVGDGYWRDLIPVLEWEWQRLFESFRMNNSTIAANDQATQDADFRERLSKPVNFTELLAQSMKRMG